MQDSESDTEKSSEYYKGYAEALATALKDSHSAKADGDAESSTKIVKEDEKQHMLGILVDKSTLSEYDGSIPELSIIKSHVQFAFGDLDSCLNKYKEMRDDKRYVLKNIVILFNYQHNYEANKLSKLLEEMSGGPTLVLTIPDDVNLLGIMAAQRASNDKLCLYDARAHTDVKYALEGMASYALIQRLRDNKVKADNELKIVNPFKKSRGRGRGRGRGGRGMARGHRGGGYNAGYENSYNGNYGYKRQRDDDDGYAYGYGSYKRSRY